MGRVNTSGQTWRRYVGARALVSQLSGLLICGNPEFLQFSAHPGLKEILLRGSDV